MFSNEKEIILRVVGNYARLGSASDDKVRVMRLPNNKTSYVEQTGENGRSVMLDEYRVDNKVIWAGYSGSSGTVYLSAVGSN